MMSEAGALDLSEAEIAARLDNMRAAIASARIDAGEMIRRIHVLHAEG